MESPYQNHVFSRLWEQAGGRVLNRRTERAQNEQGRRAIKFKTDGLHKVLILEADQRPGFEVRLCAFPEKPGIVSPDGAVTFAAPVATTSLERLIGQIDQWVLSFETIFGEIAPANGPTAWTSEPVQRDSDATGDEHSDEACPGVPCSDDECGDKQGTAEAQR